MLKKTLIDYARFKNRFGVALGIVALQCIITLVVYLAGGTTTSFTNLMYIPIILSSFSFDLAGTVATALLSGLLLGPWMPISVSEGILQTPSNWLLRTVMFLAIGVVTAILFRSIKKFKDDDMKRFFQNMTTGLPNANRLKLDLAEMLDKKTEFSLIGFRIINIDDINRFSGYEIGAQASLSFRHRDCLSRAYNLTRPMMEQTPPHPKP